MTQTNPSSTAKGIELKADTAIQGLQTAVPAGVTQILVGKVTYQLPDLVKYAQQMVQPWKTIRTAHATIRQEIAARPVDKKNLEGFLADLKIAMSAVLGRDSQVLTQFGFKPQKPTKALTPEQKVTRAAKARLTRALRGTKGSKQKAAIRQTQNPAISISPSGEVSVATTGDQATPPAVSTQPTATKPV
jgi:hypothetical protein